MRTLRSYLLLVASLSLGPSVPTLRWTALRSDYEGFGMIDSTLTYKEVIDHIWQMPWYKVAYIAITDDIILVCKTWPFFVGLVLLVVLIKLFSRAKNFFIVRKRKSRCYYCGEKNLIGSDGKLYMIGDRKDRKFFAGFHTGCIIKMAAEHCDHNTDDAEMAFQFVINYFGEHRPGMRAYRINRLFKEQKEIKDVN